MDFKRQLNVKLQKRTGNMKREINTEIVKLLRKLTFEVTARTKVEVPEISSIHREQSLCFLLVAYTSASETAPHNNVALTRGKTGCCNASKLKGKCPNIGLAVPRVI